MPTAPALRRLSALAMLLAGQSACSDNDYSTPTGAPPPQVQPVILQAHYVLSVSPSLSRTDAYPLTGELLLDGRVIWTGVMGEPDWEFGYYGVLPFNINTYVDGALAPGEHTLTFRVTDQRRRTEYFFNFRVEIRWSSSGWQRISGGTGRANLRIGEVWSLPFMVPAGPSP